MLTCDLEEVSILEQRLLGDSGISVTPIALGGWAMGATVDTWGHVDDRESIAAVHTALDCGINLIDTAPIYGLGHGESIVGKAIQGRRDDVVLATKCGLLFPNSPAELPARCLKKDSVLRECDASLRRLGVDVIDIYQCHWPDPDTPVRDTMEALRSLLDAGKIRAIGLSNFSCEEIAAAREFAPVSCLQPPFSMIHRRANKDLLPFCIAHHMGVICYSPLAKGLLTGKFDENSEFQGVRERDPEFMGDRYRRHLAMIEQLRPIARAYDKTLTQLVLRWTIDQPGITSAICGAKRPSQVLDHAGAVGWSLSEADVRHIDTIIRTK